MPLSMLRLARQHTSQFSYALNVSDGGFDLIKCEVRRRNHSEVRSKDPTLLFYYQCRSQDNQLSILLRDEDFITRGHLYSRPLSVLLLSLLPHTPSTSLWTTQPKGYVYPPSLLLSGPLLRCISVIHPSEILWCLFLNTQRPSRSTSVHLLPRLTSHPDSPSSTTTPTIDGATANTYHTAFDARSRAFSGHLAYGLDARLSAGLWCQSALTGYACAYMLAIQYAPCD